VVLELQARHGAPEHPGLFSGQENVALFGGESVGSNFGNCIDWVLRIEDRALKGIVKDLGDGQGRTRFGIAEKSHPDLSPAFYTASASVVLEEAKQVYWEEYWQPIKGTFLPTDELAATLLSFAVNDGVHQAVLTLQRSLEGDLVIDGGMGPKTLEAVLAQPAAIVAANLRIHQESFYRDLVQRDQTKVKFLPGWVTRARVVYPDLPS